MKEDEARKCVSRDVAQTSRVSGAGVLPRDLAIADRHRRDAQNQGSSTAFREFPVMTFAVMPFARKP